MQNAGAREKSKADGRFSDSLTPDGPAPEKGAQWCPRCKRWTLREVQFHSPEKRRDWVDAGGTPRHLVYVAYTIYKPRRTRCEACRSALLRPMKTIKPKAGELRPGVVAEW